MDQVAIGPKEPKHDVTNGRKANPIGTWKGPFYLFLLSKPLVGNFAFISIKRWSPYPMTIIYQDSLNVQNKIRVIKAINIILHSKNISRSRCG